MVVFVSLVLFSAKPGIELLFLIAQLFLFSFHASNYMCANSRKWQICMQQHWKSQGANLRIFEENRWILLLD
jgi:hypothetical protein